MASQHDPSTPPAPMTSSLPQLTPSFCFNIIAVQDFLRLSRVAVDDSLSLHLNALITPSRIPFTNATNPSYGRSRQQIPGHLCQKFKRDVLFTSWRDRETVLAYCSEIATKSSTDPDLTEFEERQVIMRMPSDKLSPSPSAVSDRLDPYIADDANQLRTKNYFGRPQIVDERTDPYSARDYSYIREPKAEVLRDVLDSERGVERIVRERTWRLLGERCLNVKGTAGTDSRGWVAAWRDWSEENQRR